jgi:hypothetical protein
VYSVRRTILDRCMHVGWEQLATRSAFSPRRVAPEITATHRDGDVRPPAPGLARAPRARRVAMLCAPESRCGIILHPCP